MLISFFSSLLLPYFSTLPINFFVWPLVRLFYTASLPVVLFIGLLVGCWNDVMMGSPRFCFLGFSTLLTCWLLYDLKSYFFKDAASTLPLLCYLFSFVLYLVQSLVALLFDLSSFSLIDLFLMSGIDVLYAWIVFALFPFFWQMYVRKKREV